ncbi:hypothetical protein TSTA_017880 [Talaromyces stipitatus ATCC 10500]|uniref:F-box domain-containing protein n=1 Tax=Talaromyces stipitatus (strain ATCC 10500 / CBS 375.48 / QM 6759 / NRRL 1006) TaxID=441959 RepID=B8MFI0_TALSN|nr:uncharacterized protein TSTA_017880 [Talaromyces stipitatus ATCC 10500]EED16714.1 hypothetical protein TSTA_017880 [Talaromyces stipitatus ATCC 10500]
MTTRSNPLLVPKIIGLVLEKVELVSDLFSCACVNNTWNVAAPRELYKDSLNDMQFRTPDIGSLNCLLVASRRYLLLMKPRTQTLGLDALKSVARSVIANTQSSFCGWMEVVLQAS